MPSEIRTLHLWFDFHGWMWGCERSPILPALIFHLGFLWRSFAWRNVPSPCLDVLDMRCLALCFTAHLTLLVRLRVLKGTKNTAAAG